jgi:DNA-binding PadR family transcriptional regulator
MAWRSGTISRCSSTRRWGRAKIYYRLTEDGLAALKSAYERQKLIAERLSEILFDKA